MKNIISILSIIILGIFFQSCKKVEGTGPIVSQTMSLPSFSLINSNIAANVYVTKGATQSIVLEGQQNLIDELELYVIDNTLTIKNKDRVKIINWKSMKVHITIPEWNGIHLRGSGNVEGLTAFEPTNFKANVGGSGSVFLHGIDAKEIAIDINGSGDLQIKSVKAKDLTTDISGSGKVKITDGIVTNFDLLIKGSGNFDFDNKFEADSAKVKISGSGNATLYVIDYLNATISGSGNITYFGNPKIDVDITGSGKIKNGQ